jgi:hypothetical protein
MYNSRIVFQYVNADEDPVASRGVLIMITGIAQDETRDCELCAFVRLYHPYLSKKDELILDWTSKRQIQDRSAMLRALTCRFPSFGLLHPAHRGRTLHDAMVDDVLVPGGVKIISLDDAPRC